MNEIIEKIKNTQLKNGEIALTYLGQEGFIIKSGDRFILIDGYLSDYVDRHCNTDVIKWIRKYPSPVSPEELDFIDLVLCTHAHYDHADPDTIRGILKTNCKAKFIIPVPEIKTLKSYGVPKERIIGASVREKLDFGGITIEPVAAAHEEFHIKSGEYDEVGYLFDFGGKKIFHAGDCCDYDGLDEKIHGVAVAMLPINGRDEYRRKNDIIGNMDVKEAIDLAKRARAGLLIPMHYDLYDVNCVDESEFIKQAKTSGMGEKIKTFKPAETIIIK